MNPKISQIISQKFTALLGLLIFFQAESILASQPEPSSEFRPMIAVSGGIATSKAGQSQLLSVPGDYTQYSYLANHQHYFQSIAGVFLGTQLPFNPSYPLSIGLSYYQPSTLTQKGTLLQGIDDLSSDLFNYRYRIKTRQLLAEIKLGKKMRHLQPYVSVGLGVAFNHADRYAVMVPPFLTFTPLFSAHRNHAFSYNLGAGMDLEINRHWLVGLGYRFSDFGKANLGQGYLDTALFPAVLSRSHVYLHQIIAQLTYLF